MRSVEALPEADRAAAGGGDARPMFGGDGILRPPASAGRVIPWDGMSDRCASPVGVAPAMAGGGAAVRTSGARPAPTVGARSAGRCGGSRSVAPAPSRILLRSPCPLWSAADKIPLDHSTASTMPVTMRRKISTHIHDGIVSLPLMMRLSSNLYHRETIERDCRQSSITDGAINRQNSRFESAARRGSLRPAWRRRRARMPTRRPRSCRGPRAPTAVQTVATSPSQ